MSKENIGVKVLEKLRSRIELEPLAEFDDLKHITAVHGEVVGNARVFGGAKLEKVNVVELGFEPGMNYINVSMKPRCEYHIARFSLNYMVMPDKIQFDVDLYPSADLVVRVDLIDKYYNALNDLYLNEKKQPHFNWTLSDHGWMRAMASPYYFMTATAIENQAAVHDIILRYTDVWLKNWAGEKPVSKEEAEQIAHRRACMEETLLSREPERQMVVKLLGKELTVRLTEAMV